MDALAGYGSDSDGSDSVVHSPGDNNNTNTSMAAAGISSLLGHYSGDSSDDNESGSTSNQPDVKANSGEAGDENEKVNGAFNGQPTIKRRKRWDNPKEDDEVTNVIPPPTLFTDTTKQDPYQSLTLFHKDYTTSLRQKLSQQLRTQSQRFEGEGATPKENQHLIIKLEQLYDQFQQNNATAGIGICSETITTPPTSSFAAHLKSKREFGNPHLLKTIIDHFHIQPLESHVGNTFMGFEYVDRLISAEERARVAAVNYEVSRGEDLKRFPGAGD